MKSTIYYLALTLSLTTLFSLQVNARILTVAPQSSPQVGQYNTLQAANDAALGGDTIYVYPTLIAYKGAVINKKVYLIGSGFTKANDYSDCSKILNTETLKFDVGSEGSMVSSMTGNFIINVNASNVIIQRCKLSRITVEANISNVTILNSIIKGLNGSSLILISNNSFVSIFNNILQQISGAYTAIEITTNGSSLIKNNVIFAYRYIASGYSASVINNLTFSTLGLGYEFSTDAIIQNSPNNSDVNTCFVDAANGDYHLKAGSTAIGAGTDGKDLGIYGGAYPFIVDGAPSLPTVYFMNIPASGNQKDGLSVEIKAKTNN